MESVTLDTAQQMEESKRIVNAVAADQDFRFAIIDERDDEPLRLSQEMSRSLFTLLSVLASGGKVTAEGVSDELTTTEAARLLGISRPTLMKRVRAGKIPAFRVGTHTRLKRSDVMAFSERTEDRRSRALDELRGIERELDAARASDAG